MNVVPAHYCKTCNAFVWNDAHTCPPAWKGWIDGFGDEDDPTEIYADDAEDAAEALAEKIIGGCDCDTNPAQTFEVFIFIPNETENNMPKVKKFEVTGEYSISWSAREAT